MARASRFFAAFSHLLYKEGKTKTPARSGRATGLQGGSISPPHISPAALPLLNGGDLLQPGLGEQVRQQHSLGWARGSVNHLGVWVRMSLPPPLTHPFPSCPSKDPHPKSKIKLKGRQLALVRLNTHRIPKLP